MMNGNPKEAGLMKRAQLWCRPREVADQLLRVTEQQRNTAVHRRSGREACQATTQRSSEVESVDRFYTYICISYTKNNHSRIFFIYFVQCRTLDLSEIRN